MFILATATSCVGNMELIQNPPQTLKSNPDRNRDDPEKDKKCGCEFDEYILVLGEDWAWQATILVILLQKEFAFVRTAYVNYLT